MAVVKVLIAEIDGVELLDPTERLLQIADISGATDHHAGWKHILAAETVVVAERKQMTVHGSLNNEGTIDLDGELNVET